MQNKTQDLKNILEMCNGGFLERVDYEMPKIIENLLDPNTSTKVKRTMTVNIEFTTDAQRKNIATRVTVKSKLAPTEPLTTMLYVADEENLGVVEMTPQIPGQVDLNGEVQEVPPTLRLIKNA